MIMFILTIPLVIQTTMVLGQQRLTRVIKLKTCVIRSRTRVPVTIGHVIHVIGSSPIPVVTVGRAESYPAWEYQNKHRYRISRKFSPRKLQVSVQQTKLLLWNFCQILLKLTPMNLFTLVTLLGVVLERKCHQEEIIDLLLLKRKVRPTKMTLCYNMSLETIIIFNCYNVAVCGNNKPCAK